MLAAFSALPIALVGCDVKQAEKPNQASKDEDRVSVAPELARVWSDNRELIYIRDSKLVEADKNWLRSLVGKNIFRLDGTQYITVQDRIQFLLEIKHILKDLADQLNLFDDDIECLKRELGIRTLDNFKDGYRLLINLQSRLRQGQTEEVKKEINDLLIQYKKLDPCKLMPLPKNKPQVDFSGGFAMK